MRLKPIVFHTECWGFICFILISLSSPSFLTSFHLYSFNPTCPALHVCDIVPGTTKNLPKSISNLSFLVLSLALIYLTFIYSIWMIFLSCGLQHQHFSWTLKLRFWLYNCTSSGSFQKTAPFLFILHLYLSVHLSDYLYLNIKIIRNVFF